MAEAQRFRADIEGLRAVAVLLVVLYHCGLPFLPGGYVGVDVFFVISGFLITGLLKREYDTRGRIAIGAFYARRVRRLLPAAAVVVAATVAGAYAWLPALRAPGVAADAFFTTVYGVNYHLAAAGADYLNADVPPSPLQHFWSLAVEEQFYLLWPVLLLVAARWKRTVPVLLVIVAGSLAVSVWQTTANPTWAYFGLHTRAWELAVGALPAVWGRRLPRFAAPIGLVAILATAVFFTDRTPFPGYAAVLPVAGAAAVLASSWKPLAAVPLRWLGRRSYSWYLWHWPVLMIGPAALGISYRPALAIFALGAAAVTYALVENPARRSRRMTAAGLALSLVTAAAYAGLAHDGPPTTSTGYAAPRTSGVDTMELLDRPVPAVPANLTPTLAKATADQPQLYRDGCSGGFTDPTIHRPCAYGDLTSATTVVLFGDSHAGAWFPAVEAVAKQRGWRLVVVTKSACSAASVRIVQDKLNRPYDECVQWRESTWSYIASLHPAAVVMTSAAAGGDLADKSADPDSTWIAGWARTADQLARTGAKLFLISDTPYQSGDVPVCLSAHERDPAACTVSRDKAFPDPARRQQIEFVLKERGVAVIDPTPWFCTATTCPVIVGNVLVYRDAGHVTATYARMLAPLLSPHLNP